MLNLAVTLMLSSQDALAWKHTGRVWGRDEIPLKWYISDYLSPTLDDPNTSLENSYQLQVIFDSYSNWIDDAPCGQLSESFEGIREGHHNGGRDSSDLRNTFYYDDPNDEQGAGVLGVTYTDITGQIAFNRDGMLYRYASDSDIVFSKDVNWIKTPDLASDCSGTPIEAVATHEIGHQWGMGHSCEDNEVSAGLCEDPVLKSANMFWSAPQCLDFNPDIVFSDDDIQGMTALYGPFATFDSDPETPTYGGVPLTVCFELTSTSAVDSVEWLFGDGLSAEFTTGDADLNYTCHEYTEKGQYTVSVTISGEDESCDSWEYTDRERAMVVACEVPQPSAGLDGLFSYEPIEGLTYQMINQADTTVYGCIDEVQWDIYQGDASGEPIQSVNAWSPKIAFPELGDYTIVLTLGGPGGSESNELSITVEEAKGGCSTISAKPNSSIIWIFSLLATAGLIRRRS